MQMTSKMIITGESGSGKTNFCASVVNAVRKGELSRRDIRGILSPALIRKGEKVGIQAVNLVTFEHKNLAELNDDNPGPISTKRWKFDPKVIAWCNSVFATAIPCELLVLDELGPLEFESNQGFTSGLEAVDSGEYTLALIVVRPFLLDLALQRWPDAEVLNVEEIADQQRVVEEIVQRVEGDSD
jgi:nucleoside-triphosphatase THEP1